MKAWMLQQSEDNLHLIHTCGWHDADDNNQQVHLQRLGKHCIANIWGVGVVFQYYGKPNKHLLNSTRLNDFRTLSLFESG